jgi:hypothetical protein
MSIYPPPRERPDRGVSSIQYRSSACSQSTPLPGKLVGGVPVHYAAAAAAVGAGIPDAAEAAAGDPGSRD